MKININNNTQYLRDILPGKVFTLSGQNIPQMVCSISDKLGNNENDIWVVKLDNGLIHTLSSVSCVRLLQNAELNIEV